MDGPSQSSVADSSQGLMEPFPEDPASFGRSYIKLSLRPANDLAGWLPALRFIPSKSFPTQGL